MGVVNSKTLALDVGSVRVGLALASDVARLASPIGALPNNADVFHQLKSLCDREQVKLVVIGLPRGVEGQNTAQTDTVRSFGGQVTDQLELPIVWQDEALTSVQAEAELQKRGKPYRKEDIDALAATYILEDYLREHV